MTDDAEAYIAGLPNPQRRADAQVLDALFRRATGFTPRLWSGKMIGYGRYDYTYASGHSGRWFATGFAVPDRQITVYVLPGYTPFPDLMARLGKARRGKSCLYIPRLADIDLAVLEDLVRAGVADLGTRWTVHPA
ncbi:DUF1801 domain-containing protein [Palleronia sp. KMU-117]|uniref:DUF1801 domain-containing protein n=1 Tax=Palleronia sp. KMU-117 TaxID=3434108 RepID=UPI003D754468